MNLLLETYRNVVGDEIINELHQQAALLKGLKILHINSTKAGGGVAEILNMLIPLTTALGIENRWEVIQGNPDFFDCTKMFHNVFQGHKETIPTPHLLKVYEEVNRQNAEHLKKVIDEADIVFIHDPQPAALIQSFPDRKNKWVWRCHIDLSEPHLPTWEYLKQFVVQYDASIFSLADFAQPLPHPIFLIPPSIDPCSEKNVSLPQEEIDATYERFELDPKRPMILQVSRYDRFKDPIGVIKAYDLAKKFKPGLQLVLAGGGAPDDPEGEIILKEVRSAAENDPNIKILFLPNDSHRTINALQRMADVVLQKSIKEGFGLTVTEAMWKKKPVIGGDTGGIRLQIVNHHTGFLVNTPEGAANRIRYLLQNAKISKEIGEKGHRFAKDNFLITRHLRDYLTLILTLQHADLNRLELSEMNRR